MYMIKITELAAQKVQEIQKVQNKENTFLRIHLVGDHSFEYRDLR